MFSSGKTSLRTHAKSVQISKDLGFQWKELATKWDELVQFLGIALDSEDDDASWR
jgi:hypothetical protein